MLIKIVKHIMDGERGSPRDQSLEFAAYMLPTTQKK